MATGKALDGKPYAGNPHVRFDEGEVAPAAKPRRGSLLYKKLLTMIGSAAVACGASLNAFGFSVCAIGDSITRGGSKFVAHRVALEGVFDANDWGVVWKGTQASSAYGTLNPCEGYSGNNAATIATKYEANAAKVVADVLLLHAGHNYDATSTAEADIVASATNAHARIIAAARAQNPNVIVLYAKVITSGKLPKYSYIPALNDAIGNLAAELNTAASPVVAVDMSDGWDYTTDCVSDLVHPSAAGAEKMAAKWFAALQAQVSAEKLTVVSKASIVVPLTVAKDMTLSSDVVCDTVSVASNATLNLNGYKLSANEVSGSGTIMSAKIDESPCALGYDLLSYVESPADNNTTKCYVNTAYCPSATDRIETKFGIGSTDDTQWIFGTYQSNKRFDGYITSSKLTLHLGNKNNNAISPAVGDAYEVVLDGSRFNALVAKNNAGASNYAIASNDFTPEYNIWLFAGNSNGSPYSNRMAISCKMYYFRVLDKDGNVKVNMLPVRNSSGTVGFYDTVRKRFYSPANGALTAGEVISYKALSYVKTPADNASTFVDTLYWPEPTDRVHTRVRFGNVSGDNGIFSSRYSAYQKSFSSVLQSGIFRFDHYESPYEYSYHYAEEDGEKTTAEPGTDYDIVMDGNSRDLSINGVNSAVKLQGTAMTTVNTNFMLFVLYNFYGKSASSYAKDCRMYGFQVTDTNGYNRLDLVPALRQSDSAVGFYDAVHNRFVAPASGALEGGSALPRDLTSPDGTFSMSPSAVKAGTVANLFSNNFIYNVNATSRILIEKESTPLPVRIDYDFGDGNAVAVNMYRIHAGYSPRSPKEWVLYGSNNSSAYGSAADEDASDEWTKLDERRSQEDWTHSSAGDTLSECVTKAFSSDTPYRYYRLKVKAGKNDTHEYLELVQLEYFHVENTDASGELHVSVPYGAIETNSATAFGGDMKVVKEGLGAFVAEKEGQFYSGGTEISAGTMDAAAASALGVGAVSVLDGATFMVSSPLTLFGKLSVADDAVLAFNFPSKYEVPTLTISGGASIPSVLNVEILRGGAFSLPPATTLTSGYNFTGTSPVFERTDWARRLRLDASGNLVVCGPTGLIISVF